MQITEVILNSDRERIVQSESYSFDKLDEPGFDGLRDAEVVDSSSNKITLESITINTGKTTIVADNVNVLEVSVSNINFPDEVDSGDVKIIEGGEVKKDLSNYNSQGNNRDLAKALEKTLSSKDLIDYIDYSSGSKSALTPSNHDFDVSFSPLRNSDFLVVMERYGNSTFDLRPLDASGQVPEGGNRLTFKEYSWNTGHVPSDTGNQPFFFSVISIEKFGVDTDANSIAGFRVNNDGGADFKFFTISDESFEEREVNYSGVFQAITAPPENLLNWFSASDLASREVTGSITAD